MELPKKTELYLSLVGIAAIVCLAIFPADPMPAENAGLYLMTIVSAYGVSRGISKAGTGK